MLLSLRVRRPPFVRRSFRARSHSRPTVDSSIANFSSISLMATDYALVTDMLRPIAFPGHSARGGVAGLNGLPDAHRASTNSAARSALDSQKAGAQLQSARHNHRTGESTV